MSRPHFTKLAWERKGETLKNSGLGSLINPIGENVAGVIMGRDEKVTKLSPFRNHAGGGMERHLVRGGGETPGESDQKGIKEQRGVACRVI